jgi:hypothetical protein
VWVAGKTGTIEWKYAAEKGHLREEVNYNQVGVRLKRGLLSAQPCAIFHLNKLCFLEQPLRPGLLPQALFANARRSLFKVWGGFFNAETRRTQRREATSLMARRPGRNKIFLASLRPSRLCVENVDQGFLFSRIFIYTYPALADWAIMHRNFGPLALSRRQELLATWDRAALRATLTRSSNSGSKYEK